MTSSTEEVSYFRLLRNGNFLRFFLAQAVSSLGDWIGVIAIVAFAQANFGTAAVGAVMTARVLPGFVAGPLAGVIADRWDRKKTMVVADILRGLIVFSLPFGVNLIYFLVASAALECLTLLWGPAKDASLPHFVKREHLTHANSLSLIAIYGPWPLASMLFASLAGLGVLLGNTVPVLDGLDRSPEALALWVDSMTFAFSAVMISTLGIPRSSTRRGRLDFGGVKRDLIEGLTFVRDHRQVRPWMLGIALTFTAAGGVFSLGVAFAKRTLGASSSGFGLLIGFVGTGMIIGLLASGLLVKRMRKDVLFSSCLFLLGIGLIVLASMSSLTGAIPAGSALGFFGGVAYATGYSLVQETTEDELRGRTFSAAYTLIRIGTLIGLGLFPLVAGVIDELRFGGLELPGSRVTFWVAGLIVIGGGLLSMRAITAGRARPEPRRRHRGYFVVFEGGEGAGKSTQMAAFVKWLEARGEEVVTTREPGGTPIGERVRAVLLDPSAADMDPHAEALLYAADRAQHVAEVIKPALDAGKIVLSDRFIDSSLAYQGLARGLGLNDVYEISQWATQGLLPDLVLFLNVDAETGLRRVDGERDRIEGEDTAFHKRVQAAYSELARTFPDRFVVLDARKSAVDIHREVIEAFESCSKHFAAQVADIPPPGAPVPR